MIRQGEAGDGCIPKQAFARGLGSRRPLTATLPPRIIMPRMAPVLL